MSGCCETIPATGDRPWAIVDAALHAVPAADLPAQTQEGMTGLMDVPPVGSPPDIGSVSTTFGGGTPGTWTEQWVVSTEAPFTDNTRTTRMQYLSPQPTGAQSTPSGWWTASMTFSYQPGNSAPAWPNPGGTVQVLDVYNGAVGSMTHKGRLFRRHNGSQTQDWWLLYPGYVKPTGTTCTELRPNGGTPATLWGEARTACAPSGGMYVPIQYTRAQIP